MEDIMQRIFVEIGRWVYERQADKSAIFFYTIDYSNAFKQMSQTAVLYKFKYQGL